MVLRTWGAAFTLALLLVFMGANENVSAAQQAEGAFDLGIVAVNCDDQRPANITVQEEGCRPAEGIVFTATIENGDAIGSCTAQVADVAAPITAGCSIAIPYGATVVVNEDPSTVPAGYGIVQQAQRYTAPDSAPTGQVGGVIFVNLLQSDEPPGRSQLNISAYACESVTDVTIGEDLAVPDDCTQTERTIALGGGSMGSISEDELNIPAEGWTGTVPAAAYTIVDLETDVRYELAFGTSEDRLTSVIILVPAEPAANDDAVAEDESADADGSGTSDVDKLPETGVGMVETNSAMISMLASVSIAAGMLGLAVNRRENRA